MSCSETFNKHLPWPALEYNFWKSLMFQTRYVYTPGPGKPYVNFLPVSSKLQKTAFLKYSLSTDMVRLVSLKSGTNRAEWYLMVQRKMVQRSMSFHKQWITLSHATNGPKAHASVTEIASKVPSATFCSTIFWFSSFLTIFRTVVHHPLYM